MRFSAPSIWWRAETRVEIEGSENGLHAWVKVFKTDDATGGAVYKDNKVASFKEGLSLEDSSILTIVKEFDDTVTGHIQPIFPQLVVTQIENSLAVRQLLPKGPNNFELIFHFFSYADDTAEMRLHRIK